MTSASPTKLTPQIGLRYLALILISLGAVGPFVWLLLTALKSNQEGLFDFQQVLPQHPTLDNFRQVWQQLNLNTYVLNSVVVAILTIGANLVFSTLAAYPLARMPFRGRSGVFLFILATMMIPFQVLMIPLYLMTLQLGLTDSQPVLNWLGIPLPPFHVWLGLALPFAVSGFGIFFMRQALVGLPKELEESALLDGCNRFEILYRILLPLVSPSLATLAVFTFMTSWGEFLWPSIVLSDEANFTLPVGLVYLQGAFSANWRVIAAGTLVSMIPMIVFFLALQRYFISGTLAGSVKG